MSDKIKKPIRIKDWTKPIPDPEGRFVGLPMAVEFIDGVNWRLNHAMSYHTEASETSTVKAGFVFDFASVPRWLAWLYPAAGDGESLYGLASLWHDWLYCHRKIGDRPITRKEADDLFYEIMRYLGVSWWTASRMYRAVRVFGWLPWGQRRPEDITP